MWRCLTLKLKRGGREGKRVAAGASAAPAAQPCGRKMPGPLSLAALLLGGWMYSAHYLGVRCMQSCNGKIIIDAIVSDVLRFTFELLMPRGPGSHDNRVLNFWKLVCRDVDDEVTTL